jgi:site-specific recombinase XerD
VNSADVKNFAFDIVVSKRAEYGYFVHTSELQHQALGLVTELKSGENARQLIFWGPDKVIDLLQHLGLIKAPPNLEKVHDLTPTKQLLLYTYLGRFWVTLLSNKMEPTHYHVEDALSSGKPISAEANMMISQIEELRHLSLYKDTRSAVSRNQIAEETSTNIHVEIQRFLDQHAARSPHTARTYRTGLARFAEYLAERGIQLSDAPANLTRAVALDFIPWLARQRFRQSANGPEQPLSMRSRQLYVRAVSGLYRQLALEGTIPLSYSDYAALNIEMGKATNFKPSPIEKRLPPEDVIQAIIEMVQSPPISLSRADLDERQRRRLNLVWLRDQAIVLCLHSSGMRVGELVSLRRGDLDYTDHGAWVRGKGDRTRFVRFSHRAWAALMAYLDARHDEAVGGTLADKPLVCRHDRGAGDQRRLPLSTLSIERIITFLAKEAGVLERFNLTPHSFRHYFATRFLQHTGDLALTQDALGHADPGTTRVYAKTSKAQHIQAHESLFDKKDEGG